MSEKTYIHEIDEINKRISRLEINLINCTKADHCHSELLEDYYKKIEHNFRNINDIRAKFEAESYKNKDVFARIE